jgi:hypothetical protein
MITICIYRKLEYICKVNKAQNKKHNAMERIFEPKNDQENELVKIIKTNQDKRKRKKALQELLVLNGLDKNDYYTIRSKEVYARIPNRPPTWTRFWSASIVYDDCILKR